MPSNVLMYSKMTLTFWSSTMGSIVPEWVHCTRQRECATTLQVVHIPYAFLAKILQICPYAKQTCAEVQYTLNCFNHLLCRRHGHPSFASLKTNPGKVAT